MLVSELIQPEAYMQLPRIPREDIRWLWFDDFWDGPRSGLILYREQKYWVDVCAEHNQGTPWYRRFMIIVVSAEQLQEEEYWHALFEQKVGTHTTLGAPGQPIAEKLKPQDQWDEFYTPYAARTPPNFAHNEVIGWFED